MEAKRDVITAVLGRATRSRFGEADRPLIEELFRQLEIIASADSALGNPMGRLRQSPKLGSAPLGSGIIFNLQGIFEHPRTPQAIRDVIQKVFDSLDPRDTHYRYGPCTCSRCRGD